MVTDSLAGSVGAADGEPRFVDLALATGLVAAGFVAVGCDATSFVTTGFVAVDGEAAEGLGGRMAIRCSA